MTSDEQAGLVRDDEGFTDALVFQDFGEAFDLFGGVDIGVFGVGFDVFEWDQFVVRAAYGGHL